MQSLVIQEQTLQREIDDLALITEAVPPVVTRVIFSEADLRGREFVKKLCRDAGLVLCEDAVATGSHSPRPDECFSPEQIKNGVAVLAQTLAKLAA